MKHAYLIIAHNNVAILQLLLSSIDDEANDIYVHIDKKADYDGSSLRTNKSRLTVIHQRYDARWGDFSLVEVELELMRTAFNSEGYEYFHIISGVDVPIKSQAYIHSVCDGNKGTEYLGIANASDAELRYRSGHYFAFPRMFKSSYLAIKSIRKFILKMQDLVGYRRNTDIELKKGSQWCSITSDLVKYLLEKEDEIRRRFNHTFCPDEVFIQTMCWNSAYRKNICNVNDEFDSCRRFIKWSNGALSPISVSDIDAMKQSNRWFARKISQKDEAEVVIKRTYSDYE